MYLTFVYLSTSHGCCRELLTCLDSMVYQRPESPPPPDNDSNSMSDIFGFVGNKRKAKLPELGKNKMVACIICCCINRSCDLPMCCIACGHCIDLLLSE